MTFSLQERVPTHGLFAPVLLFWAWQSGYWLAGAAAAAWLEWASWTQRRWQLTTANLNRLVDLTSLGGLAVVLHGYSDGPLAEGLFAALHGAPLLLLPLVSAQLLSGRLGLERRSLYYSQRRSQDPGASREIDLRFVYLAAVLLAAGQEARHPDLYYPGLVLIAGLFLWPERGRSARDSGFANVLHRWRPDANLQSATGAWLRWALLLVLAASLGYLGQMGLRQAQIRLEEAVVDWLMDFSRGERDPYRATTALGDIGHLKLSDRILYRLETPAPLTEDLLLRTSSYDRYAETTWFSSQRHFREEIPRGQGDQWQWPRAPGAAESRVRIAAYLEEKRSLLPMPTGTWRLEDLPVSDLARHPFGAVRVGEGPGLVRYLAWYAQAAAAEAPPTPADWRVPRSEQPALAELAAALNLDGLAPAQIMQRVRGYFRENFRYSLELPGKPTDGTALEHFLRERRRGHCEYFATATVLLLRQAGLPARYAVGYSVQESAGGETRYLVRRSQAHAWALVWHSGQWWDLDSTPAVWFRFEAEQRSFWQPLLDLLSEAYFQFTLSRLDPESDRRNPWLWGLLGLLSLLLAYRLRVGQAFRRHAPVVEASRAFPATALAGIEQALAQAGFPRQSWETPQAWRARLGREPHLAQASAALDDILRLYYRERYAPGGLGDSQARELRERIAAWRRRWQAGEFQPEARKSASPAADGA